MIELPVARLRDDAILPSQAYEGDAGLDLAACERLELGPGERGVVGTGIAVAIPEGWAGLVLPRSGLAAKHGLTVVNSPGLIDSGYRGEVMVILLNTDEREPFVVEPGMRIAQLVLVEAASVRLLEVDELSESERGARRPRLVGRGGEDAVMARSPGSASRRSCAGATASCSAATTSAAGTSGCSRRRRPFRARR